jgi:hypothetical protein
VGSLTKTVLLKHPAGISRRLKDPGGIDESIDLSRDR